jgi:hypothetical protein
MLRLSRRAVCAAKSDVSRFQVTPADAPELLERAQKASHRPFIDPERARAFTASAVTAAAVVGGIYWLLAARIDAAAVERSATLDVLLASMDAEARRAGQPLLPTFRAPSAYSQLARELAERERNGAAPSTAATTTATRSGLAIVTAPSVLRGAAQVRAVAAWNNTIDRLQAAVRDGAAKWADRRVAAAEEAVRAHLLDSYAVVGPVTAADIQSSS